MENLCPQCGAKLNVPEDAPGQQGRCPECQAIVTLEAPAGYQAPRGEAMGLFDPAADAPQAGAPQAGATEPDAVEANASHYTMAAMSLRSGAMVLPMSLVGAAVGASLGAAVWFAVEYFLEVQVGYVAILCGAAAGIGAVTLNGGVRGPMVGAIAALMGLAGIFAGNYGSYIAGKYSDETRRELRVMFDEWYANEVRQAKAAGYDLPELTPAQREEAFEEFAKGILESEDVTYYNYLTTNTGDLEWMGVLGLIGLGVGYKVGTKEPAG